MCNSNIDTNIFGSVGCASFSEEFHNKTTETESDAYNLSLPLLLSSDDDIMKDFVRRGKKLSKRFY